MANVTPWDVSGNVDYDQLVRDFGVKKITDKQKERIRKIAESKGFELHHMLRRNIFFAHRDLDFILDEYEKGNKFFLYTGRSPSGKIHLGHLFVWDFTKWLQDVFDVDLWFQFPDEEKLLFKSDLKEEEVKKYLEENLKDVAALGFNPEKTFFIVNTWHASYMYKHAVRVARKLTLSSVKSTFGLGDDANIGATFYTAMQAVPTFLAGALEGKSKPCLIPHAVDQDPHFRLTRDVVKKLGYYKPSSIQSVFLPGLQGFNTESKMSSSKENTCIFLDDSPSVVKKKINKYAFSGGKDTVEEHRKYGGDPDVDVAYNWLYFYEEDDEKIKKIYKDYKSGELLTGELKKLLIVKVNEIIENHQKALKNVDVNKYLLKR